ncbi:acyl-CoA dehydrogenase family protein [Shouchella hunanensis]|uniref:Acyl-CoA dehydrogenase family protein n=1 Tax=Shouchella hunanensis TaxID=766894 RepID=A0ABY7VZ78_9BACI|nr:acyl-CoA dehydrogenase family protein [Shouchella hunanensis]WDF02030.1 acyl-CoA dehydrogenase family protein [Shouchella hunanensis]
MDNNLFLNKVEMFAEDYIRPIAGEIDKKCSFPIEIINSLGNLGVLGATVPKEYGGLNLDPLTYGNLTESIGKACSATRTLLTVHTALVCETLVTFGTEKQKEKYLPLLASGEKIGCFALSEPNVGSDARSVKTNYEKKGNEYVINGIKKWISFAEIADIYIVIAINEGEITAFLLEKDMPGITVEPVKGLMASRGSHTGKLTLKNVAVSKEQIISRIGNGFSFVVNSALFYGRFSVAWGGVGLAKAALEEMAKYSRKREQFNTKIGNHQLVKRIIGDSVTKIHAGRALCEKAAGLRMKKDDLAMIETNIAKYFTSKTAVSVTADAVQILGANGCTDNFPVERLYRESKVLEIIEGSSQIQEILIGNFGLKQYGR